MSKRMSEDEGYDMLQRKIRKLEKKLKKRSRTRHRRRHRRSYSVSSRSSDNSPRREQGSDEQECNDEQTNEPMAYTSDDLEVTAVTAATLPIPSCSNQSQVDLPAIETVATAITEEAVELDQSILEILGTDPSKENIYGVPIQSELATRLEHYSTKGLTKSNRMELKELYLVPNNCKLINAPILNPELKAVLTEVMANRDKAIEMKQTQLASAISALGQALTRLFANKEKDTELIKTLMDTSRILCDCQHSESMRRRGFVLSSLKKDIKDPLTTSTNIDKYLFGEDLAETIKATKAINKSSTELKASVTPKPAAGRKPATSFTRPLNWMRPFQSRRQPEHHRTKESAVMKQPPQSSSSRPSQHQQRGRRR